MEMFGGQVGHSDFPCRVYISGPLGYVKSHIAILLAGFFTAVAVFCQLWIREDQRR